MITNFWKDFLAKVWGRGSIAHGDKILWFISGGSQTLEGLGLCGKDLSSPEGHFLSPNSS